jgi:hypothetical protein
VPSVFDGTNQLIDEWLGLTFKAATRPLYRHKQAWLDCSALERLDGCCFVRSFLCTVDKNCRSRQRKVPASKKNWRFERRTNIDLDNQSEEMCLERALVRDAPPSLANAIPVASGVCTDGERRRAIDLAQRHGPGEYTFFELKVRANNPLYAAMELLGYGACYVAARCNMSELGYKEAEDGRKELLGATVIHLRVLAPLSYYYDGGKLLNVLWLQSALNDGLRCVGDFLDSLQMDFAFEAFPEDFALNAEPANLRDCFCRRVPVYPLAAP